MKILLFKWMFIGLSAIACSANDANNETTEDEETIENPTKQNANAKVISVEVSGSANNYTFSVGISSTETGCDQYANWWEVLSEDGALLYRRILAHSHVNEQPFVRAGGAVSIPENQIVYIRAHMNTSGYGTQVFKGSVQDGFEQTELSASFAEALASQEPLPEGCAF